jgi:glucose-1-phosphate cytidylyltransferase
MVSGGFFVLSPKVIDLIVSDETIWEKEPMEQLVNSNNMMVHRHTGFWQPMDMLRDKLLLEDLWSGGSAPWLRW